MIKYNDNELLYLISEKDEIAFELIIKKYEPLIKNRLVNFKINILHFDDFYQECMIVLNNCVHKYREDKQMSFNGYLDNMIQYKIRNILQDERDYYYTVVRMNESELDSFSSKQSEDEIDDYDYILSKYEKEVYDMLKEEKTISAISLALNRSNSSIYNAISRLKRKLSEADEFKYNSLAYDERLSKLENAVNAYYINGYKARDISYLLRIEVDTVYNAIKRIKKKLKV